MPLHFEQILDRKSTGERISLNARKVHRRLFANSGLRGGPEIDFFPAALFSPQKQTTAAVAWNLQQQRHNIGGACLEAPSPPHPALLIDQSTLSSSVSGTTTGHNMKQEKQAKIAQTQIQVADITRLLSDILVSFAARNGRTVRHQGFRDKKNTVVFTGNISRKMYFNRLDICTYVAGQPCGLKLSPNLLLLGYEVSKVQISRERNYTTHSTAETTRLFPVPPPSHREGSLQPRPNLPVCFSAVPG